GVDHARGLDAGLKSMIALDRASFLRSQPNDVPRRWRHGVAPEPPQISYTARAARFALPRTTCVLARPRAIPTSTLEPVRRASCKRTRSGGRRVPIVVEVERLFVSGFGLVGARSIEVEVVDGEVAAGFVGATGEVEEDRRQARADLVFAGDVGREKIELAR